MGFNFHNLLSSFSLSQSFSCIFRSLFSSPHQLSSSITPSHLHLHFIPFIYISLFVSSINFLAIVSFLYFSSHFPVVSLSRIILYFLRFGFIALISCSASSFVISFQLYFLFLFSGLPLSDLVSFTGMILLIGSHLGFRLRCPLSSYVLFSFHLSLSLFYLFHPRTLSSQSSEHSTLSSALIYFYRCHTRGYLIN